MTTAPDISTAASSRIRCVEMARTPRGWEMCHRDQHAPDEPHHVKDRSWYSGQFPRLRLCVPCGEACGWADYVVAYLGVPPRAETGGPKSRARVPSPPRRRRATLEES